MANVLVISEAPQRVIIRDEAETRTVKVVAQGPQGPQGPVGPQGLVGDVNPLMPVLAQQATDAATLASSKASEAASSASNASAFETAALSSKTLAAASEASAGTQATNAATSAASALASATAASDSATLASTQAGIATDKARDAATDASTAIIKANEASASAATATSMANAAEIAAAGSLAHEQTAAEHSLDASTYADNAAQSAATAVGALSAAAASATSASNSAASASGSASTATTQASNAAASASTASTQAGIATTSASDASVSASAALASESLAQAWATQPEDVPVIEDGTEFSSLHWAAKSQISQGIAGAFATSAVDAAAAAVQARNDAVAVVTGGTASLTPAAGKLPIAGANGKIDQGWFDPLPGVTAAALHRSPNAVTAMFVYDTSKDSDGGAWTEKCQHTSWYNEPINGKWLGAQASETAARAVSGATTGDYFQRTTDGLFYSLNAGSGITLASRGNKRDFPRLAAIVAEALNVTIYDLTEPGRPMWLRFAAGGTTSANINMLGVSSVAISAVAAVNGILSCGGSGGYVQIDFYKDRRVRLTNADSAVFNGSIAQRNSGLGQSTVSTTAIANAQVNAVAMTVLPDAPADPVSGLQVPTIAAATNGGVSVIKQDGSVFSGTAAVFVGGGVRFTPQNDITWIRGADATYYLWPYSNWNANSTTLAVFSNKFAPSNAVAGSPQIVPMRGASRVGRNGATLPIVSPFVENKSTGARSINSYISNTYNTGHMVGDIRRAYLSDNVVGSVSGPGLVTNGTFDTDISGWSVASVGIATISWSGGDLVGTTTSTNNIVAIQSISGLVAGKTYLAELSVTTANQGLAVRLAGTSTVTWSRGYTATTGTTLQATIVAPPSTTRIEIAGGGGSVSCSINSISLKEVVADRSYKAQGASITGTLTKSAVASAAELVAYSGFSAANYLRETYSADLDMGAGEWSASAWVNVPTANTAAGTIACREYSSGAYIRLGIDATNKLTATAFDGTTTRTVTTTAAYNTATWAKAEACYTTDGTLSIRVNGVEVAATRGNPLLTLNNSNAVLTIGNSYALDAPFPGSIALLKLSATVPTAEQSQWMYEQEKQMFREGAQACLPDSGSIVDLAYDEATDKWIAASATNISEWSGLVRTNVTTVPSGSYSKLASAGGVTLQGRTTTTPGVDITIPAYGLREELVKRAESAARMNAQLAVFDYVGGFTATTVTGSTAITSVAGLTYPASYIGAAVTGAGIPANTTVASVSGTTIYLSAAATASAAGVQISFTDFALPVGYEAKEVSLGGVSQVEGSTKAFVRRFDGFKETIRFNTAPAYNAAIQIQAARSAA